MLGVPVPMSLSALRGTFLLCCPTCSQPQNLNECSQIMETKVL